MRFNLRSLGVQNAANQAEQYYLQNNGTKLIVWKASGGSGENTVAKFSKVNGGWKIIPRFSWKPSTETVYPTLWNALDFQLNEFAKESMENAHKYENYANYMEEKGGVTIEVGRKINTVGSLVL